MERFYTELEIAPEMFSQKKSYFLASARCRNMPMRDDDEDVLMFRSTEDLRKCNI